ncbi:hypothetical protein FFF34_006880 [Inquilinus sp. KBS0705]|nr:hypothetical protein FFF34_006880 [Inquilinus sp. KBS0705]
MPKFLFPLLLILMFSCKQKNTHIIAPQKRITVKKALDNKNKMVNDSTFCQSSIIDNQHFIIGYTSGYNVFVIGPKGDTIYKDLDGVSGVKFIDFNDDGFKDILIDYFTNVPDINDLLLYDKNKRTFRKVIDFDSYPASQSIVNSKYYYSYSRRGCADMNWESDLFYITNFKVVKIAKLEGYECGNGDIKDGIYIYRTIKDKKVKFKQLPIETIRKYKDYKWGFIKDYWSRNYKLFK